MGKLILFIVIILLLVGGSYYFFAGRGITPSTKTDQTFSSEELSASNEPAVVEQELQATELANLDKEFADINAELDAALNEAQ